MRAKRSKAPSEAVVKGIRRATRKQYGAEQKIRIVLEGLRGKDSVAELTAVKALRRACITNGRRTSWKLASAGWQEMLREQPKVMR